MSTRQTRHKSSTKSPALKLVNSLQRQLFDYEFLGLKNLHKDKPSILVGNHSIYAWDVAIMLVELKMQKEIELRSLADRMHGNIPPVARPVGKLWCGTGHSGELCPTDEEKRTYPGISRRGEGSVQA